MTFVPENVPPAFYPVSPILAGRPCVVIGPRDDREALDKAADLREAGADVRALHDHEAVTEDDVAGAFLVISTPQNATLSAWLSALSEKHRFLLCTIDQPAYASVALQAIVKSGPARIAISTGGISPRVGGLLRAGLQAALDATFARFLACLAHQRRLSRARNAGDPAARRAAMLAAAGGFEVHVNVTYPGWFSDECARLGPQLVEPEDAR
jgi:precorrin-2 dehydrogenase/sirohydrochlorin ferrochelatase